MRSLGVRLPILAVTAWAGFGLSVWASSFRYGETVYVSPTSATYAVPTAYESSPVFMETSAFSFPSYLPTAYEYDAAPMGRATYLTSAYRVRRGLLGRLRVVERPVLASYATSYTPTTFFSSGYYPTSYRTTPYLATAYSAPRNFATVYAPTVYEDAPPAWGSVYATSRSDECDQVAWNVPAAPMPAATYVSAAPSYVAPSTETLTRPVQSETSPGPAIPSTVSPAPIDEPPLGSALPETSKPTTPAGRADSPPAVPAAPRQQSTAQPATATPKTEAVSPTTRANPKSGTNPAPPAAPGADPTEPDLKPAPIDNPSAASRRESLRPSFTPVTARPEVRNVLLGRVESDAGEPLSEVPVSATSRDGRSIRRADTTDAFGDFAIRLDDGEWTVNVQKPSGRVFAVRTVTVSNGKVVDNEERREVRKLVISY